MANEKTENGGVKTHQQRLNEEQLKAQANSREGTSPGPMPEAGKSLPKGFHNPQPGQAGHRCLDPQGRYQPSWYCLLLHDTDGMPTRQPFNCAGKRYYVRVGEWVDVPPDIINILRMAEVETVSYAEADGASLQSGTPRPSRVSKRPRFNYNVLASA